MMEHWATQYLGQPWSEDMDCWGWFRYVQEKHYGIEVPSIAINNLSVRDILKTFDAHPERKVWHEVDSPSDGDGVLMGRSTNPIHVGVWITPHNRVFHCEQKAGIVIQSLSSLELHHWSHIRFYRHASRHTV